MAKETKSTLEVIERLKKISLFTHIKRDKAKLKKIATIIKKEKFLAGKYIIVEGEVGDKMFILNKGIVRIEKQTLAEDKFTIVNLKSDMNIFFGEQALMDNDTRSASILAVTDVECYTVKQDRFEKLCNNNKDIGYCMVKEIAKILSTRLRKANIDNIILIEALVSGDENGG